MDRSIRRVSTCGGAKMGFIAIECFLPERINGYI